MMHHTAARQTRHAPPYDECFEVARVIYMAQSLSIANLRALGLKKEDVADFLVSRFVNDYSHTFKVNVAEGLEYLMEGL